MNSGITTQKILFSLIFSVLFIPLFTVYSFGQIESTSNQKQTQLDLEIEKLAKEIEKLEKEVEKINLEISPPVSTIDPNAKEKEELELQKLRNEVELQKIPVFYETPTGQQVIGGVITVIAAAIAASTAYYKSKKIIPFSDREKTFRQLTIQRHHNLYRAEWKKIQRKIIKLEGDAKNKEINRIWNIINKRDFPEMEKMQIKDEHLRYVEIHAREGDFLFEPKSDIMIDRQSVTVYDKDMLIVKLAKNIAESSYEEYFKMVETKLPQLVSLAVTESRMHLLVKDLNECEMLDWGNNALEEMKKLMIFNNISEYESTVRTMIVVKIKELVIVANKPKKS